MKMIMAVIKPSKLDDVRGALSPLGVTGMTVSEVKGFGRQGGHTENFVTAIRENANTGKIGDGKIFVFDVAEAVRIRTGETNGDAL